MADKVYDTLRDFGILAKVRLPISLSIVLTSLYGQLLSMCMDNASSCDSLATSLEIRLDWDEDLPSHMFEGLKSRTQCFGHISDIAMQVSPTFSLTFVLSNII